MVEDRITDGHRIAELLASELTGLATGPLADVSVTDADPGAEPSPSGTEAYAITYDGTRVGVVTIYPDRAVITLRPPEADPTELGVDSGAAVKRAVDRIRGTLTGGADG